MNEVASESCEVVLDRFAVLLCSDLSGDILSDLAAVPAGWIGMAPSAKILPGASPGLFEPAALGRDASVLSSAVSARD